MPYVRHPDFCWWFNSVGMFPWHAQYQQSSLECIISIVTDGSHPSMATVILLMATSTEIILHGKSNLSNETVISVALSGLLGEQIWIEYNSCEMC